MLGEERGQAPDDPVADAMVVLAHGVFEGVAERRVADIVDERGDPEQGLLRLQDAEHGEESERVLES
nr:hypothetical protein [Clavibacter michiganensis]